MPVKNAARTYDVVLYGATGFVGQQTVAYFASHPQVKALSLKWAVAGRSKDKLQAALRKNAAQAGVIVADAQDAAALDALARSARVVLSTAGPFALYGSELVAACVRHGTHYVDITGETPWVRGLIDKHHARAALDGTRIIPCCGFDSIPSDLGVWLAQQAFQSRFGTLCTDVKGAFSVRGGFNGGTLASMFNMFASGQASTVSTPYLLNPADAPGPNASAAADPVASRFDKDFNAWLAPFMMGPINTRVVRRSAALLGYAPTFQYQEYMRMGKGAGAAVAAGVVSGGSLITQTAMGWSPVRKLAQKMAPQPGEGPSEEAMDGGSFRYEWVATGAAGQQVRGRVADRGDPGNRATTKMLCESALALALQSDELPGAGKLGGVLTPASGLGEVLVKRLQLAGMTLEVDD
ncbi:MAG: saccharopine dehydrogenase NADP-binding domain-containing protein [Rhodoferax sp.]|nr:saccharopine dehydrogenase NADP-binding domain-containing protein [Rhodoferax sp.]